MRARVQQGDRGVNGGEGRAVAWPGGEAAMAPQARRGDDGELVPWRRRARSSGVVMAKLSKVAARRQRAQQARAAVAQQAGGGDAASSIVRTRAFCARGVNAERRKGERERVLWSTILARFKIKIFML